MNEYFLGGLQKPNSSYAEIYRTIRTDIEYANFDNPVKVVSVTSTIPNEAKTTNSAELAIAMANKFEKVLLIDCDLRKPSLHKAFQKPNYDGVTDFLRHSRDNQDFSDYKYFLFTYNHEALNNPLDIMPTGTQVINPSELIGSAQFRNAMKFLREQYDVIIIDCPPVGVVSDAVVISQQADGVVFVIERKQAKIDMIKRSVNLLKKANVNILGSILTKVPMSKGKSDAYGYNYHYSDYHSE